MRKQKLLFKPTPISRLRKRPSLPFRMVGYPHAVNWERYWRLNYEFMLKEKYGASTRERIEKEYGPFVDDWAA